MSNTVAQKAVDLDYRFTEEFWFRNIHNWLWSNQCRNWNTVICMWLHEECGWKWAL